MATPIPPSVSSGAGRRARAHLRWAKRFVAFGVICVLLLLAARVWWGWEAKRRFDAAIAGYRAAGQPVTIPDFEAMRPELADAENGAYHLRLACQHMSQWGARRSTQQAVLHQLLADPALREELQPRIAKFLEANAGALEDVRKARAVERANWRIALSSPLSNVAFSDLGAQRDLARILGLAARYSHERGDDETAIERVQDALAQARHVGDCFPSLIVNISAVAMEVAACSSIEAIVPHLQVGRTAISAPSSARPAAVEEVEALIRLLLNEGELDRRWKWGMYGERLIQLDAAELICTGRLTPFGTTGTPPRPSVFAEALRYDLGPAWRLDGVRMMRLTTVTVEAGLTEAWPEAREIMSREAESNGSDRGWVFTPLLSSILLPSFDRAVTLQYRRRAEGRMAATSLALRLYELQHGRRADALAALVPAFLPAVPRDPFDPAGGPIRYKPDGPTPMLYSVNEDGVDDGGQFVFGSGSMKDSEKDLPFFLAGGRPVPPREDPLTGESYFDELEPASTQAAPHDEGVAEPRQK